MKTLQKVLLAIVVMISTAQAHAVMYVARPYDPNSARWISRDPIGEIGGENLYGFVYNDPQNSIDFLGFSDIEFLSDGQAYYDGPPNWWRGMAESDRGFSGVTGFPSAYFWSYALMLKKCGGGICNSTDIGGENSSHMWAKVHNRGKCSIRVHCKCNVHWFGSNFTPSRLGRKGFVVKGRVLDATFNKNYDRPSAQPDGSYIVSGTGDFSKEKTFTLKPDEWKELFYGTIYIAAAADNVGAGYRESMNGECQCEQK